MPVKHAKRPAMQRKLLPRKRSKGARQSAIFVRRSPFLISYWRDKRLIVENYLTRRKIAASPDVVAILDFCSESRRMHEIVQRWPEHTPSSVLGGVARLVKETLLQVAREKNPREDEKQKALRNWKAWNPAASFFHLSTKDTYADEVTPEEIAYVEQLAKLHPVPKPLKAYPGARSILLKRGVFAAGFPRVLRERRTWREFSRQKVSREMLSTLLELSFGIQGWEEVPTIGKLAQKTSPSGGALHPGEAYVLASRVEGVAPGI